MYHLRGGQWELRNVSLNECRLSLPVYTRVKSGLGAQRVTGSENTLKALEATPVNTLN